MRKTGVSGEALSCFPLEFPGEKKALALISSACEKKMVEGNLQNSNSISPQKNPWIHRSNVGDAGNFACCLNVRKPA